MVEQRHSAPNPLLLRLLEQCVSMLPFHVLVHRARTSCFLVRASSERFSDALSTRPKRETLARAIERCRRGGRGLVNVQATHSRKRTR